ncbi:MAG: hypothetical protein Q9184_003095 [Pyrenodesmia sp. 2 TL-2023]
MADPLTIATSIAGLVTLADLVFGRIFQYAKGVKEASNDIFRLSSEVGALYGILNTLRLVACQLEDEAFRSATRPYHLYSCTQTLEKLKAILDKDSTSCVHSQRVKSIKRKLHWPFKASEVKSLLAEIERHKATLGLALNADDEIRLELRQKHEADTRVAMSLKREGILKTFGKVDPSKNQKMGLKLRQQGTGSWLIESQEFGEWSQTNNAKLWLHGIPGAGKTVLAATVIEEALRTSNTSHAVAFFYCDYKDTATQEPRLILGSLSQQIAKQDEQSFAKLQSFCERQNPECKDDFQYESQELRDLVLDLASSFDSVTVVVDGLDECGSKAAEVTELITSLNVTDSDINIKTILLSRDEFDIRNHLEDFTKLEIAAKRSDLRLYVAAEIDIRVRKNQLRIKDQSLKAYIMERLENRAEGMFRWVACQMDFLCELPNDSSRRKALENLPPTLNATYERILKRINASSKDVQLLVSRTLRWIVHCDSEVVLSTAALCEAVAINFGDTRRDVDNIPDEFEILRRCSSLVRKSADGDRLELAHFTVKVFLQQIGPEEDGEFAAFRIGHGHGHEELAKTCLTFLSFEDFNQVDFASKHVMDRRIADFPLRRYAVLAWDEHTRNSLRDDELSYLMKQFMDPGKHGTLISWAQDLTLLIEHRGHKKVGFGIAEASPLHFAAMLAFPEICTWLIDGRCDVNRSTVFGTPLHCALMGPVALDAPRGDLTSFVGPPDNPDRRSVINILLEAGADPNRYFKTPDGTYSPLFLSLHFFSELSTIRLLGNGAMLDEKCLDLMEEYCHDASEHRCMASIMVHVEKENVQWEHQPRVLLLRHAADQNQGLTVLEIFGSEDKSGQLPPLDYGRLLRTAAELGQVEAVTQFLKTPKIDVEAAEKISGRTAMHYAAMRDHLKIVKQLQSHGAQLSTTDQDGKAAIHHTLDGDSFDCLEFFLKEAVDHTSLDNDGYSLWHLAAVAEGKQALEVLARNLAPIPQLSEMKTKKGWSPLLCAASVGFAENVEWLLGADCSIMDTAADGSTALHLAAESFSFESLSIIRVLLDNDCNVNSCRSTDGQSPLMSAAYRGDTDNFKLLLSRGADIRAQDKSGLNAVHYACERSHLNILQCLRHENVEWNKRGSRRIGGEWWTGVSPFHLAAGFSRPELPDYLLDEGLVSDINAVTDVSATALFIAAWLSRPEIVSSLLERGADPTIMHEDGRSPVHVAALFGDEAVISVFLQYGCDVEVSDPDGINCEMLAMKHGHKRAAKMFREYKLQHAAGRTISLLAEPFWSKSSSHHFINLPVSSSLSRQPQRPNNNIHIPWASETASPLHLAAVGGHVQVARFLLERGANANKPDGGYMTPLHWAAAGSSTATADETAMTELLLEFGANVHAVDASLRTPCMVAVSFGRHGPLRVMIARGADLHMKDRWRNTVLHYTAANSGSLSVYTAANSGSLSVLHSLIVHGLSEELGRENPRGYSPLSLMLSRGNWHELLFLLNLAPDPTVYTPHASNSLVTCVENPNMTQSLLKKFLRRLSEPVVNTLLAHRAKAEGTPLYAACTLARPNQQDDVINILLDAGAELDLEGGDHGTPLMGACAAGRLAVVKLLVSKGAKISYEKDSETVSALNKAKHFPEIIRWLLVERFTQGPRRILNNSGV